MAKDCDVDNGLNGRTDDLNIPDLIRMAGDGARLARSGEFLDDAKWNPGTRKLYGTRARRFFQGFLT